MIGHGVVIIYCLIIDESHLLDDSGRDVLQDIIFRLVLEVRIKNIVDGSKVWHMII